MKAFPKKVGYSAFKYIMMELNLFCQTNTYKILKMIMLCVIIKRLNS